VDPAGLPAGALKRSQARTVFGAAGYS